MSRGLLSAIMVVALAGLGLAIYLSWAALTSSPVAGCGGGQIFDCSHVLHSKWSKVMGVPVGIPAASLYLITLLSISVVWFSRHARVRTIAMSVVSLAALSAGAAAIWFIGLQLFVVEHLCSYCLAAHSCGLILAGVVLWKLPLGLRPTLVFAGVGLASVGALASAQIMAEEPKSYEVIEHPIAPANESSTERPSSYKADSLFSAPGFDDQENEPAASDNNVFEAPGESESSNQSTTSKTNGSNSLSFSFIQLFQLNTAMVLPPPTLLQEGSKPPQQSSQNNDSKNAAQQEERKLIAISGGQVQLDVEQWPLIGSTDADKTFVEMFDYTCPHCRANHKFVQAAVEQMDNKVAVIALAVPMNSQCNNSITVTDPVHLDACELAKLSVAVWRVDPSKFADFHDWLFAGDRAPTAASARSYAGKLVDTEKFEAEIASDVPGQYVAKQVELYKTLGAGTVPKLLFPGSTVNGTVDSTEALLQIIQQQANKR